jgi:YD repeat-containing protein
MTLMQYPGESQMEVYGRTPGTTYTYDVMGRPSGIRDCGPHSLYPGTCAGVTATATWDASGNLTNFNDNYIDWLYSPTGFKETRTYNNLGQLTRLTSAGSQVGTAMDVEYVYTAGRNNGRIGAMIDHVTGETVNYTYDTVNRLSGASTSSGSWGTSYTYDGWGNLTDKTRPTRSLRPSMDRPTAQLRCSNRWESQVSALPAAFNIRLPGK